MKTFKFDYENRLKPFTWCINNLYPYGPNWNHSLDYHKNNHTYDLIISIRDDEFATKFALLFSDTIK